MAKILWRPDKDEIAFKAIEKYRYVRYGLRKIVSRHFNFSIMKQPRRKKNHVSFIFQV